MPKSAKRPAAKPKVKAAAPRADHPGIKKQYMKSKPTCKVTFALPLEAAPEAKRVTLCGDFNAWDKEAAPLKRLKDGHYSVTIELPTGREYRFRFLIDGSRWENHWEADRYAPNPYGGDDSIVEV